MNLPRGYWLVVTLVWVALLMSGCTPGAGPATGTGKSAGETGSEGASATLTLEKVQRILDLHNRGIGYLENMEWVDAEAALSELQRELPQHVDIVRNLAISRTLTLIARSSPYSPSTDRPAYANAISRANDSILHFQRLADSGDEKAIAALLSGKLAAFEDSPATPRIQDALEALRQAIELSGNRPEMWYAYALALEGHRDYADSTDLIRALQEAAKRAGENLAVAGKLLEKQALGLNSKNDDTKKLSGGIATTLETMLPLIEPLNPAIKKQRNVDLVDTVRKALTGAAADNPAVLLGPAMMVRNLTLPELSTQIDQRRIDLNLLEYLVIDIVPSLSLSDELRNKVFPAAEPTVISAFSVGTGLPEVSGVTDVQLCDMNLDGADDLVLVQDGRVRVFSRGPETASEWSLLMESPADAGSFSEVLLVDIDRDFDRALSDIKSPAKLRDRDGDQKIVKDLAGQQRWFDTDSDVIAWGDSGVVILRNDRSEDGRSLTRLPQSDSVAAINDVAAADLEADGDLDLIFGTSDGMTLWKNLDGAAFQPITEGVALPDYAISALAIGDWNRDMAMDVIGVSPDGKAGSLENMLHGRFRWIDNLPCPEVAADVAIDDLNGDGQWDLVVAGQNGVESVLHREYRHRHGGSESIAGEELSSRGGDKLELADLDNDGRSDMIVAGNKGLQILRGMGYGLQAEDLTKLLPPGTSAKSVAASDMDDDGDLDLVCVTNEGGLQLLVNEGGDQNQWIDVVARAVGDDPQFPSNRVNMQGIGAVIEVRAGSAYQAHIVHAPRLHLGLGKAAQVDTIRVIWTDGVPQNITKPELLRARLGILAPQILMGSCPYIYTWNGERFEFFSDCLWAAPIGLIQATGDMAPTREWEYLMIPGEQLKARDGRYVLQLTEELWEAAYFDEVRLMVVDHPAEVDIFTNEKVGSPELAAHRIHTVKNRRVPVAATDGLGRDLLPGLAEQDQDYVQPFRGRILQGLTDEWTMDLDPGMIGRADGTPPDNVRLVLIGWVFPTNTSLNEAIIQNPRLDPPAPPSLEVIDAEGAWKTVRPFIGFPSGKTKAMVVDLSDVWLSDDYRVRIRSSMELYWDAVFFIVDETDAETRSYECALSSADLHYRGFSRRTYSDAALFRNGHAPESYDYDSVSKEPRWNEMLGQFTRYGEVRSLLQSADDQLVVMGPGDELTVEFTAPPNAPPAGWKRDFVLYNVGWDKDADLSTVYGQSSEPYPFRAMTRYPIAPDEEAPRSLEYQTYLQEYQIREYPMFRFRDAIRKAP